MVITVDTNIIFQGLYSSNGASHMILRLIRDEQVRLALSVPVFLEYCEVLKRPSTLAKTGLRENNVNAVLDLIAYVGYKCRIDFLYRPNLSDESDNKFVELALASNSDYLITANIKHFTVENELTLHPVKVVTPGQFIRIWRIENE
jgi:putative PIN family toxin of toxin-antitoxin system